MTAGIRFTRTDPTVMQVIGESVVSDLGLAIGAKTSSVWSDSAWQKMHLHAASDRMEVAGVLRGWVGSDREGSTLVFVEDAIPARGVETSGSHVSFNEETWNAISRASSSVESADVLVGWYHTHPGLSAFFSGTDRTTQRDVFRESWQIGVVLDPQTGDLAVFSGPESTMLDRRSIVHVEDGRLRAARSAVVKTEPSPSAARTNDKFGDFGPWVAALGIAAAAVFVIVLDQRRRPRGS